jgi:hypothetical protein
LLHAGFSVPRMLPSGRWALTPPFHPCQMRSTQKRRAVGFSESLPPRFECTGGLIFCGTFRSRIQDLLSLAPKSAPWRYQARCPSPPALASSRRWSPDFPPVRSNCKADRRSPSSPAKRLYRESIFLIAGVSGQITRTRDGLNRLAAVVGKNAAGEHFVVEVLMQRIQRHKTVVERLVSQFAREFRQEIEEI